MNDLTIESASIQFDAPVHTNRDTAGNVYAISTRATFQIQTNQWNLTFEGDGRNCYGDAEHISVVGYRFSSCEITIQVPMYRFTSGPVYATPPNIEKDKPYLIILHRKTGAVTLRRVRRWLEPQTITQIDRIRRIVKNDRAVGRRWHPQA